MGCKHSNRIIVLLLGLTVVFLAAGCGHVMHPKAEAFLKEAKGATGVDTAITLTGMMETSLQQARSESGESAGLEALHGQFHALGRSFCDATEAQSKTALFDKAVTIRKEMKTVFHRLWDYKGDAARRTQHLDLFGTRLHELRETLQAI